MNKKPQQLKPFESDLTVVEGEEQSISGRQQNGDESHQRCWSCWLCACNDGNDNRGCVNIKRATLIESLFSQTQFATENDSAGFAMASREFCFNHLHSAALPLIPSRFTAFYAIEERKPKSLLAF